MKSIFVKSYNLEIRIINEKKEVKKLKSINEITCKKNDLSEREYASLGKILERNSSGILFECGLILNVTNKKDEVTIFTKESTNYIKNQIDSRMKMLDKIDFLMDELDIAIEVFKDTEDENDLDNIKDWLYKIEKEIDVLECLKYEFKYENFYI